jgi:hypothetical protein
VSREGAAACCVPVPRYEDFTAALNCLPDRGEGRRTLRGSRSGRNAETLAHRERVLTNARYRPWQVPRGAEDDGRESSNY